MKPSVSTMSSVGLGVPAAIVLSWLINVTSGVEVPGPVEGAMGALIGGVIGYFFRGGKASDTE